MSRLPGMEAVAIGVVVFGPLAAVLLLLLKAIRRLTGTDRWRGTAEAPPGGDTGGDPAGDREPRRPLMPAGSGAVGLVAPDDADAVSPSPRAEAGGRHDPGHRLAG